MFLSPEDLEEVTVGSLLSLVANTGPGLALIFMNKRGDTMENKLRVFRYR